jgi:hypothetical protein
MQGLKVEKIIHHPSIGKTMILLDGRYEPIELYGKITAHSFSTVV